MGAPSSFIVTTSAPETVARFCSSGLANSGLQTRLRIIASKLAIRRRDMPLFLIVVHAGMAASAQDFETSFGEAAALNRTPRLFRGRPKYQSDLQLEPKSVEANE